MAKLGFFGLGIMGAPMARHLLDAGQDIRASIQVLAKFAQVEANSGPLHVVRSG